MVRPGPDTTIDSLPRSPGGDMLKLNYAGRVCAKLRRGNSKFATNPIQSDPEEIMKVQLLQFRSLHLKGWISASSKTVYLVDLVKVGKKSRIIRAHTNRT